MLPIGLIEPSGGLVAGCDHVYVLKAGDSKSDSSHFLSYPRSGAGFCGAKGTDPRFRCEMTYGFAGPFQVFVNIAPGEMSGSYLQGLTERWTKDSDRRDGLCFAEYTGNGERVVVLPLIMELPGGKQVQVAGYGSFFLRNLPDHRHDDLLGEFLTYVVIGSGGGDSTGQAADVSSPSPRPPTGRDPELEDTEGVAPLQSACLTLTELRSASVDGLRSPDLFLASPRPSPAHGPATFRFGTPNAGRLALVLYDVSGRVVRVLANGDRPAGEASVTWDLRDASGARVPPGTYFVRLMSASGTRVARIPIVP